MVAIVGAPTSAEWLLEESWEYDNGFDPSEQEYDRDYVAKYVRQGDFDRGIFRSYILEDINLGVDHLNYIKEGYEAGLKIGLEGSEMALFIDSEAARLLYNEDLTIEELIEEVEDLNREQKKFTDY